MHAHTPPSELFLLIRAGAGSVPTIMVTKTRVFFCPSTEVPQAQGAQEPRQRCDTGLPVESTHRPQNDMSSGLSSCLK